MTKLVRGVSVFGPARKILNLLGLAAARIRESFILCGRVLVVRRMQPQMMLCIPFMSIFIQPFVSLSLSFSLSLSLSVSLFVSLPLFLERPADRDRDRETHTHRHRDTQTRRQTDTQTHRPTVAQTHRRTDGRQTGRARDGASEKARERESDSEGGNQTEDSDDDWALQATWLAWAALVASCCYVFAPNFRSFRLRGSEDSEEHAKPGGSGLGNPLSARKPYTRAGRQAAGQAGRQAGRKVSEHGGLQENLS